MRINNPGSAFGLGYIVQRKSVQCILVNRLPTLIEGLINTIYLVLGTFENMNSFFCTDGERFGEYGVLGDAVPAKLSTGNLAHSKAFLHNSNKGCYNMEITSSS